MIESLRLENFKRHTLTTLKLASFTLLVGPNGSGKTSVLEALHLLSGLDPEAGPSFRPGFSPARVARRQPGVDSFALSVAGQSHGEARALSLRLQRSEHTGWHAELDVSGSKGDWTVDLGQGLSVPPTTDADYWPELHRAAFLHLDARRIAEATEASPASQIDPDGAPLATVLANRKLADEPSVAQVLEALRRLVPEFQTLRVVPATVATLKGERHGYRLEFDTDSGKAIAADDMSEGTLLLLALLSVLHSPSRPRLLLLDAIDADLHPSAQMQLAKLLQALVEADGSLQIIASTHSPYVVDAVDPSAVLVFAKGTEGRLGVRALSEHPEYARFKGQLSSGQLWTLDDETAWVLKPGP